MRSGILLKNSNTRTSIVYHVFSILLMKQTRKKFNYANKNAIKYIKKLDKLVFISRC